MFKKFSARLVVGVCAAVLSLVSPAAAAVDMFLKIDGIEGESTVVPGGIEVLAYSWGVSNSGSTHTGGGGGAGKANVQDISFTKFIDKSSPKLVLACAKGNHIPKATLTVRKSAGKGGKAQQQDFLIITMEECLVSSYSTGASSNGSDDLPTDNVTLNFAKVTYSYISGEQVVEAIIDIAGNIFE